MELDRNKMHTQTSIVITVRVDELKNLLDERDVLERQVTELQTRMSEMVEERREWHRKYGDLFNACNEVLRAFGDDLKVRLGMALEVGKGRGGTCATCLSHFNSVMHTKHCADGNSKPCRDCEACNSWTPGTERRCVNGFRFVVD